MMIRLPLIETSCFGMLRWSRSVVRSSCIVGLIALVPSAAWGDGRAQSPEPSDDTLPRLFQADPADLEAPIPDWRGRQLRDDDPLEGKRERIDSIPSKPAAAPEIRRNVIVPEPEGVPLGEPVLGISELEAMALASNPSILRAAAQVSAARGNWIQVGLPPNPTVGYEGQQLGSGGLAEQHGVTLGQEIVRGGKLRLNRAIARQELAKAEQQVVVQQQRVLTDVRLSYFQVLLAQRQIDIAEDLIEISRHGGRAVDALLRAKEASRTDVLQAQLEIENAEVLRQNARNRHEARWRELRAVVGQANLPVQPLRGDPFVPPRDFDFQETLARLQSTSPEIAAAHTEIDRARFVLERARVEPIPNLSFQGAVNVIDNGIGGKTDGSAGVSLPIPLFNRNQGAILKAQHEVRAATQALQQLELELQSRLSPTFERYANARNQVERFQATILPAAAETLELTQKMYEAGETNFLALLTAQRTFSQTSLNYVEALLALRLAEVEMEGLLLRDSLSSP